MKALAFAYGAAAYLAFILTLVYAIGFVGNAVVPKGIDGGAVGPIGWSLIINSALLGLFAVQHSVMARPAFKVWWMKIVPRPVERSTFVLLTSLVLALMMWQWRPIPAVIWCVDAAWARFLLYGISYAGFALVVYASFVIDHFDLFGLRQVYLYLKGLPYTHPPFAERSLYKRVRHPLMLGFLVAFWCTPDMTVGHLQFAVLTTAYILIAIQLEERDLLAILGPEYRAYRQRTAMLLPVGRSSGPPDIAKSR